MIKIFNKLKSGIQNKKFLIKRKYFDRYSFIHINKCGGTSIEYFLKIPKSHDTAEQRIIAIGSKRWEENFTFAVVRNPYARVVSYHKWYFRKYQSKFQEIPPINDWIKAAFTKDDIDYFEGNPFFKAPCFDWVTVDNEVVVKNIIKLENLDSEWRQLCKNLSINHAPLNVSNSTSMHSAKHAYDILDNDSIDIINNLFKKDFDAFSYKMIL
jgi:chondroitin 4-sulfotransferase 11